MKKISVLATLLAVVMFAFTGCEKEASIKNVLAEFARVLDQAPVVQRCEVKFDKNPYEGAGITHNSALLDMNAAGAFQGDETNFLQICSKHTGFDWNSNPHQLQNTILLLNSKIWTDKGEYAPDFVEQLSGTSNLEKEILNMYFEKMSSITDWKMRVELSKKAEEFVINSKDFKKKEKENLLSTFAVFRYSTYLWENQIQIPKIKSSQISAYNFYDARGEYLALHGLVDENITIEDGKDVHMYAASLSAAGCIYAAIYPNMFLVS